MFAMKRNFIWMVATASICLFSCCEKAGGNEVTPPEQKTQQYDVLGLGEIPIGLWVTPPAAKQNTEEYARIRRCGINFVNGFCWNEPSNAAIKKALDLCGENDLLYFSNKSVTADDVKKYSAKADASLLRKFVESIKPYASHPAFAGELLMDEPGLPLFEALSKFTSTFERNWPDKMWHINLFPAYATGGIQASSYEEYINKWFETMSPKYLSYDSYPLLTDGSITDDYFYNLDFIRMKTRFKKIPFWTFIQTLSIAGTPGVPDKREPSEADIRWQVWSNLAFGAKGIQYFCYWSPGNGSETFGDALIDLNGNETVRYAYVKKLNSDINAIGKILMKCDAEGVILNSAKNYRLHSPLYSFDPVEEVNGDCIVGCFTSADGKKKALITPVTPDTGAKVTLVLKDGTKNVTVWKNDKSEQMSVSDGSLAFEIAAGDAVFVEF